MTEPTAEPTELPLDAQPVEPSRGETMDESIDYASAMRELEGIVAELEREAVDVDHLSTRVKRAAELVELLRARIADTRMEVARVITDLDSGSAGDS